MTFAEILQKHFPYKKKDFYSTTVKFLNDLDEALTWYENARKLKDEAYKDALAEILKDRESFAKFELAQIFFGLYGQRTVEKQK